ncbi:class F sortase [Streptacidiphilus sp. PAMC 29251]
MTVLNRTGRSAAAVTLAAALLALSQLAGCSAPAAPSVVVSTSTAGNPAAGPATGPVTSAPAGDGAVSGAPAAPAALARSVPERLEIPGIGVDTPVMQLGLAADGTVGVPPIEAHSPAGWYDGSPTPGQVGPAVILGHVTVGQFGDGVFLHLSRMKAGDRITVVLKDGHSAEFAVDSVQTVAKSEFPKASVYGNVDHPALRLITCGGTRAGDGSGYTDNVVVYASLVRAT